MKKNSVNGIYVADKAKQKTSMQRWRAKEQCLKVAMDSFFSVFVEERLQRMMVTKTNQGSLEERNGHHLLRQSHIQVCRKPRFRSFLFWGWNNTKEEGRGTLENQYDGRKYIDERPERTGPVILRSTSLFPKIVSGYCCRCGFLPKGHGYSNYPTENATLFVPRFLAVPWC